jgi:hypothetical protein
VYMLVCIYTHMHTHIYILQLLANCSVHACIHVYYIYKYIYILHLFANCSVLRLSSASEGCACTVATRSVYEFLPRLRMYVCVYVCVCVCVYACKHLQVATTRVCDFLPGLRMYVCMCVCVYEHTNTCIKYLSCSNFVDLKSRKALPTLYGCTCI